MKRVAITTLGCKANWSDSEAVVQALRDAGLEIVRFDEDADAYVVNTCAVTAYAGAQSRQMLRRAKRRSPGALVIAAGCYGQVERDELAALEGVDAIFGSQDRQALLSFICERLGADRSGMRLRESHVGIVPAKAQSRARAFLKIQEGCDRRCAYCIVPLARGRSRSMRPEDALEAMAGLSRSHREIVIAGIDIGQYGRDLRDGTTLKSLLRGLEGAGVTARVRLSTLGPLEVDDELIGMISSGGICRHVHLSIQSGSDGVLERMRRGYCASDVRRAVEALRTGIEDIAITGDVIAGFPGEREDEHMETVGLIASLPLAGLHVFPYSRREGTLAARMDDQIPKDVKKRRALELRELAARHRAAYLEGLVGKPFDVIVTSRRPAEDGTVEAVADTAVKIRLPAGAVGYGEMGTARMTGIADSTARGTWE